MKLPYLVVLIALHGAAAIDLQSSRLLKEDGEATVPSKGDNVAAATKPVAIAKGTDSPIASTVVAPTVIVDDTADDEEAADAMESLGEEEDDDDEAEDVERVDEDDEELEEEEDTKKADKEEEEDEEEEDDEEEEEDDDDDDDDDEETEDEKDKEDKPDKKSDADDTGSPTAAPEDSKDKDDKDKDSPGAAKGTDVTSSPTAAPTTKKGGPGKNVEQVVAPSLSPSAMPTDVCIATGATCSNDTATADPCCSGGRCMLTDDVDTNTTSYKCFDKCINRLEKCSVDGGNPFQKCCGNMDCVDGVCDILPTCVRIRQNCSSLEDDPTALPCCRRLECIENTCQAPVVCRKKNQTCGGEDGSCCDGKICIQGKCELETRCRRSGAWCNATAVAPDSLACCNNMRCEASSDSEEPTCVQPCMREKQTCQRNKDCCGSMKCGPNKTCRVVNKTALGGNLTNVTQPIGEYVWKKNSTTSPSTNWTKLPSTNWSKPVSNVTVSP